MAGSCRKNVCTAWLEEGVMLYFTALIQEVPVCLIMAGFFRTGAIDVGLYREEYHRRNPPKSGRKTRGLHHGSVSCFTLKKQ